MPFELLRPIKQIAERSELAGAEGVAEVFGHIDHFGVEVADPLHFVFGIREIFDDLVGFIDHVGVDSFTLEFGNDPKNQSGEFLARHGSLHPEEFEFVQQVKFSVQFAEPLVQVGEIDENGDRQTERKI